MAAVRRPCGKGVPAWIRSKSSRCAAAEVEQPDVPVLGFRVGALGSDLFSVWREGECTVEAWLPYGSNNFTLAVEPSQAALDPSFGSSLPGLSRGLLCFGA